ncbi:hypothetical protein ACFPES_20010 [Paenibacillus sp. GCM10023248]|uniref:hypothetical protein n=1 Tax=unclassified Paenibacillus TaxID=185978 RepID=UPI0023793480|nr:hypothetical protein [Paenibacillus sp. MAHUQ-63]MDD9269338.1 hypothetical protein [Paenibacillus sp. MAHUQ-63]
MKKIIIIILLLATIMGISFYYIFTQAKDAFTIDSSHEMRESAATELVSTEQKYGFRLVNVSDKKIKLLNIELQGFVGITLNNLTIDGEPFIPQLIPSHRYYMSNGDWSTNSQGVNIEYLAKIMNESINNPESVKITYSYMGVKHRQIVRMPGTSLR